MELFMHFEYGSVV